MPDLSATMMKHPLLVVLAPQELPSICLGLVEVLPTALAAGAASDEAGKSAEVSGVTARRRGDDNTQHTQPAAGWGHRSKLCRSPMCKKGKEKKRSSFEVYRVV